MSLPQVLSALRFLILDERNLPSEVEARRELLKRGFGKLSDPELDDLSKISPDKLGLYTNSIFTAEASIIERNFPFTLELLNRARGEKLDTFKLMRDVHAAAPWQGIHSYDLGRSLLAYLAGSPFGVLDNEPSLCDAAHLELLSLELRKAPNGPKVTKAIQLSDLSQFTVDSLLALRGIVPEAARMANFDYDVLSARATFFANDRKLLPKINLKKMNLAGGRQADYGIKWVEIEQPVSLVLQETSNRANRSLMVEEIAAAVVSNSPELDEAAAFSSFFNQLVGLVEAQVVVLENL